MARTGSTAGGVDDRWSDIDFFLGIRAGTPVLDVLAGWSSWVYAQLGAVHHFDLHAGPATYRAFLLRDGLEVDLGMTPQDHFGPTGDGAFDVVFGEAGPRQRHERDTGYLIGLGWHHAMHAGAAIAAQTLGRRSTGSAPCVTTR